MVQAIFSVFIGFVGGAGAIWAKHYIAWRPQKQIELRRDVFDEAIDALAKYEADALDRQLQAAPAVNGERRFTELRPKTAVQMQRASLLVQAFFPETTFDVFAEALRAHVSLNNVPNTDFAEKAVKALKLMANDIRLFPSGKWMGGLIEKARRVAGA